MMLRIQGAPHSDIYHEDGSISLKHTTSSSARSSGDASHHEIASEQRTRNRRTAERKHHLEQQRSLGMRCHITRSPLNHSHEPAETRRIQHHLEQREFLNARHGAIPDEVCCVCSRDGVCVCVVARRGQGWD